MIRQRSMRFFLCINIIGWRDSTPGWSHPLRRPREKTGDTIRPRWYLPSWFTASLCNITVQVIPWYTSSPRAYKIFTCSARTEADSVCKPPPGVEGIGALGDKKHRLYRNGICRKMAAVPATNSSCFLPSDRYGNRPTILETKAALNLGSSDVVLQLGYHNCTLEIFALQQGERLLLCR